MTVECHVFFYLIVEVSKTGYEIDDKFDKPWNLVEKYFFVSNITG